MFPRRTRLPKARFEEALRHGRRLSSAHFSIAVPFHERGVAVVVSKKTARLSVTRHRIKRRVLAALRTIPHPPGLIVFPKAATLGRSIEELSAELSGLLSKI